MAAQQQEQDNSAREQDSAAKKDTWAVLSERVAAVEGTQHDLRERLLALREGELLQLKEKVQDLRVRLMIATGIAGALIALLSAIGLSKFNDLNELATKTLEKKLDESFGYYDQLGRALVLVREENYSRALPILRDLWEIRPDDETVFMNLTHCYLNTGDFENGVRYVEQVEAKRLLGTKFQQMFSWNNAGVLLLAGGLRDSIRLNEAITMLQKAYRLAINENNSEFKIPLFNLFLCYASTNNRENALGCLFTLRQADSLITEWQPDFEKDPFLKHLFRARPAIRTTVLELLNEVRTDTTRNRGGYLELPGR